MPEPRKKAKPKRFYIDTNIALDYATNRDPQTFLFLEKIKEKKWKIISSSFLVMELADYKKESIFISKALSKKWETRKILREVNNNNGKNLKIGDFEMIQEWTEDFKNRIKKFELYDFLQDAISWDLAQEISLKSELSAPDSLHLASAIVGAKSGDCDVFLSKDKLLLKEGERIVAELKMKTKLKILDIAQAKKLYLPS